MLSQAEADNLILLPKKITTKVIDFPHSGEYIKHEVLSVDDRYQFILDINRRNSFSLSKCGYQERYQKGVILVRLDLNGAPHTNPDGIEVPETYIHIYKENYDDAWACISSCSICIMSGMFPMHNFLAKVDSVTSMIS